MNVGQLIKLLADWCPDTPVVIAAPDDHLELSGQWEYDDDTLYLFATEE